MACGLLAKNSDEKEINEAVCNEVETERYS